MIEFRLLGTIDLRLAEPGNTVPVLTRPKDLALLAYLAVATPRGFHRRDILLALFWPDSDEARARGALNQSLYRIRQWLGDGMLLTRGNSEVGLNWSEWWCDAVELRAAAAAGRYEKVLELYHGELLSGFHADASPEFEQWLDGERTDAREAAAQVALQLAADAAEAGDDAGAIACLRRALVIKPFEESALQRLMDVLHRKGESHSALAEYERFAARLASNLDLEPSRQSAELASRISSSLQVNSLTPRPHLQPPRASEVPPGVTGFRWKRAAAIGAALLLPTLGAYVLAANRSPGTRDLSKGIVVSDFVNRTAEKNLAAAVTEALTTDLSQSDVIRTVSEAQIGAILKRMSRDTTRVLTGELAREVALRDGLNAVLRGEVAALGSGYVISAQLISADSGRVLFAARENAAGPKDVIAAVDRLSERLRKRMGDSLRGAHANQPLEAVTTSSLEALKLYSAALRGIRYADVGDGRTGGGLPGRVRADDRAVSLFEQAIALDSSFASAYRALAVHLYWFGENSRVRDLLTRAYQLRHQLTERERLETEGTYAHFVMGDYDRAIECFEQLLERDANDIVAIQQLGYLRFRRRDFTRAVAMYERDWALRGGTPAILYTSALLGAGRIDRADSILQRFARFDSTGGLWHGELLRVKAGRGDFAAVDTLLPRMLALAEKSGPHVRFQAKVFAGRWKIWRGRYSEGMELLNSLFPEGTFLFKEIKTAEQELYVLRDPVRARRRLDAAVANMPPERLPPADRPYAFLANMYAHAGDHKRAAAFLRVLREEQKQRPPQSFAVAGAEHMTGVEVEALSSAAAGDIQRARQILATAEREIPCWYFSQARHLLRARVEEIAGQPDSAIAALERLVAAPTCGLTLSWSDVWGPHTQAYGHERLGELYYARGEAQRARFHYQKLVELWPNPDPLLRARWRAAKDRIAELSKNEPSPGM